MAVGEDPVDVGYLGGAAAGHREREVGRDAQGLERLAAAQPCADQPCARLAQAAPPFRPEFVGQPAHLVVAGGESGEPGGGDRFRPDHHRPGCHQFTQLA